MMAANRNSGNHGDHGAEEVKMVSEKTNSCINSGAVCEESGNNEKDSEQFDELSLDNLPSEIFLHICTFLDAKFVIRTLSLVCRLFHDIVNDNVFWKIRIAKRWPKKYPPIPVNDAEFNWAEACLAREEQHKIWSDHQTNMDHFIFREGLYGSVDSVHIMKEGELLATGSRDRYLNVLDLQKLDANDPGSVKNCRVLTKMNAHKGWIWCMSSLDGVLATGGWDTMLKFWDLAAGGQEMHAVKCTSAVLCTHYEPDYIVAGAYDKQVYHIDPRCANIIGRKRYHRKPVLCLQVDDKYIVSGSEDKSVVIYDRAAAKVYKTIEFTEFPMCMSYGCDQLWVGDKMGKLTLIDATDADFNIVETYDVGHKCKMTGVIHTPGAIFTCSMDKPIQVLEPSLDPGVITTITNSPSEVAGIDYKNGILASAYSDISVGIWKPHIE